MPERQPIDAYFERWGCCNPLFAAVQRGDTGLRYYPALRLFGLPQTDEAGLVPTDYGTVWTLRHCPFCGREFVHDLAFVQPEIEALRAVPTHRLPGLLHEARNFDDAALHSDGWWWQLERASASLLRVVAPTPGSLLQVPVLDGAEPWQALVVAVSREESWRTSRTEMVVELISPRGQSLSPCTITTWPYAIGLWSEIGADKERARKLADRLVLGLGADGLDAFAEDEDWHMVGGGERDRDAPRTPWRQERPVTGLAELMLDLSDGIDGNLKSNPLRTWSPSHSLLFRS